MGQVSSHSTKPFDYEEFSVAWLAFKGEMSKVGSRNRPVASKTGLASSKLLRSLYSGTFLDELTQHAADGVPREHFIVLLAQHYLGNTEDKLGYIFAMYHATYGLDRNNADGGGPIISSVDVECLLEYMASYHPVPETLVAVFDDCQLTKESPLTLPIFIQWVRQSPSLMTTMATTVPPHVSTKASLSVHIPEANSSYLPLPADPLNMSPSMAFHGARHHQSFDIVGGDSSEEEEGDASLSNSDENAADDDVVPQRHSTRPSPPSGRPTTKPSTAENDTLSLPLDMRRTPAAAAAAADVPPLDPKAHDGPDTNNATTLTSKPSSKPKGNSGIGKFGRAVGGGIRTILLHPSGKTPPSSSSSSGDRHPPLAHVDNHHYVGGYLHKVSDGKWAKRNWHVRWFVLDMDRGVLAYYKSNPSSIVHSPHGSVAFYDDFDLHHHHTTTTSSSSTSTTSTISDTGDVTTTSRRRYHHRGGGGGGGGGSHKPHPWYRGCMDLNEFHVSLLFDKQYGHNAPNKYIFQVSSLGMGDAADAKRGFQYKLCANSEDEFVQWTSAIAQVINRKHLPTTALPTSVSVQAPKETLQQQLHRQKLHDRAAAAALATPPPAATSDDHTSSQEPPITPQSSTKRPPRRHTLPPTVVTPSSSVCDKVWRLQLVVDGRVPCLVVLFCVNMASFVGLNYFGFLVQVPVMALATYYFFRNVPTRQVIHHRGLLLTEPDGLLPCTATGSCCLHPPPPGSQVDALVLAGDDVDEGGGDRFQMDDTMDAGNSSGPPSSLFQFDMLSSLNQSTDDDKAEHAWSRHAAACTFNVRSKEYKKSKKKEPSQAALFEFVGVDVVRTDGKIDCIAQHVNVPPSVGNSRLFILHAQMPLYAPSLFTSSYDGPGASLIMYWTIPEAVEEALRTPDSPATHLLARFLNASDPSILDRFKVIAQVVNEADCGVTGYTKKLLTKNNGTPVLTRPQHRMYHTPAYTEVDVDVHVFSLVARTGIHALVDKTAGMLIDVAFVLQGESEDELPEQVLGVCRLVRVDLSKAAHVADVAARSCGREDA